MGTMRDSGTIFIVGGLAIMLSAASCVGFSAAAAASETSETSETLARTAVTLPDPIETLLAAMPLRDKIAQLFIVWIPRGADAAAVAALKSLKPGGYILYSWNYATAADVRALTATLSAVESTAAAAIKPFICVDQEGGRVAAFRFKEMPSLPSAFSLASFGDRALLEAAARLTAAELRYLGCNLNLAPVADLYPSSDSTIIGDRSFGPVATATAAAVAATVRGLHDGGIMATVKHFPGHGVTTVDSHGRLPVADLEFAALKERELVPFIAGIRAGAPVVMTAHILYSAIDPENPATLSPVWLKDILRGQLGFDGLILTDGFEMGALTQSFDKKESLARAFEAGIDLILLYSRYDPAEMIGLTETLIKEGRINEAMIESSVKRTLDTKYRFGLLAAASDRGAP